MLEREQHFERSLDELLEEVELLSIEVCTVEDAITLLIRAIHIAKTITKPEDKLHRKLDILPEDHLPGPILREEELLSPISRQLIPCKLIIHVVSFLALSILIAILSAYLAVKTQYC